MWLLNFFHVHLLALGVLFLRLTHAVCGVIFHCCVLFHCVRILASGHPSTVDEYLGSLQFEDLMNEPATNTGTRGLVQVHSLPKCLEVKLSWSQGVKTVSLDSK